jgi:hypothetical protein
MEPPMDYRPRCHYGYDQLPWIEPTDTPPSWFNPKSWFSSRPWDSEEENYPPKTYYPTRPYFPKEEYYPVNAYSPTKPKYPIRSYYPSGPRPYYPSRPRPCYVARAYSPTGIPREFHLDPYFFPRRPIYPFNDYVAPYGYYDEEVYQEGEAEDEAEEEGKDNGGECEEGDDVDEVVIILVEDEACECEECVWEMSYR